MNDVEIKVTVPHWIAVYLMEMCQQEAEYWRTTENNKAHATLWEKLAGDIQTAIEKEDKWTT